MQLVVGQASKHRVRRGSRVVYRFGVAMSCAVPKVSRGSFSLLDEEVNSWSSLSWVGLFGVC